MHRIGIIKAMQAEARPLIERLGLRETPPPWDRCLPPKLWTGTHAGVEIDLVWMGQDDRHSVDLIGTAAATLAATLLLGSLGVLGGTVSVLWERPRALELALRDIDEALAQGHVLLTVPVTEDGRPAARRAIGEHGGRTVYAACAGPHRALPRSTRRAGSALDLHHDLPEVASLGHRVEGLGEPVEPERTVDDRAQSVHVDGAHEVREHRAAPDEDALEARSLHQHRHRVDPAADPAEHADERERALQRHAATEHEIP